jgi:hypothetical protein
MVGVIANGRIPDKGMFSNTMFQQKQLSIPESNSVPRTDMKMLYVSIKDDVFPLIDNLMNPVSHRKLSKEEAIYNY